MKSVENNEKTISRLQQVRDAVIAIVLLVVGVTLVYYYQSESSSATPMPEATQLSMTTDNPIVDKWLAGPHADTFVVDAEGTNDICTRCHAPDNFIPSMDDIPPSCYAAPGCHFEVEEMPPFITEEQWLSVQCRTCHEIDKDGVVQPEYAWLAVAAIDEYETVESTTELCLNCHKEFDQPEHISITVGGVHDGYSCTDCHDAHDTFTSCSDAGCHETPQDPTGHDLLHPNVNCIACHDASELAVAPSEQHDEAWFTFISTSDGNEGSTFPYTSHNIQLEVECERCHFSDNPWGLSAELENTP